MTVFMPQCGFVHDATRVAADVELVVPDEVSDFVAAHGGRLFVWVSVHPGFLVSTSFLDTSLEVPEGDRMFHRLHAPGFDVYLEATQQVWPKKMEFGLRHHRRVEAYWNGCAWIF